MISGSCEINFTFKSIIFLRNGVNRNSAKIILV